mmetsp:Transcript_55454/g.109943  ORF Transcript_55454/g.109943 Transcript_55454/m.109943 type:complete len:244 (-) Transcript_55454:2574-3305(-)
MSANTCRPRIMPILCLQKRSQAPRWRRRSLFSMTYFVLVLTLKRCRVQLLHRELPWTSQKLNLPRYLMSRKALTSIGLSQQSPRDGSRLSRKFAPNPMNGKKLWMMKSHLWSNSESLLVCLDQLRGEDKYSVVVGFSNARPTDLEKFIAIEPVWWLKAFVNVLMIPMIRITLHLQWCTRTHSDYFCLYAQLKTLGCFKLTSKLHFCRPLWRKKFSSKLLQGMIRLIQRLGSPLCGACLRQFMD